MLETGAKPFLLSILLAASLAVTAQAQTTTFAIQGYRIDGNTLLGAETLERATRPFIGPESDFETIQRALEALEKAYIAAGYGSVRVEIPEQELESGLVTLQVVEGVLGDVVIEPDAYFNAANIRHSLPALQPGQTVNIFDLNRNLVVANDSGSKVSNVTFKRSESDGKVDAVVKVVSDDPQRWVSVLDNSGNASTGYFRLGLVYQNNNLWNLDHGLSVQVMTSPDHLSQVSILGLGYRLPMYSWGGSFDFSASHSTVDSGTVAQPGGGANLAISGSGDVFGVRYTHNLNSSSDWQHKASVGLEERFYGNSVTPTGGSTSLVPNLTTQPLTLGYSGNWRSPARELNWSANWLINIPGGSGGSTRDFNQSGGRAGSKAEFQTLKFSLQHTERYASQWVFRAGLTGQYTEDLLIAAEQFGVGGADSVRGFGEREVAADQGVRLGFETWAPPLDISDWRLVFLGFLDSAMVWRNQPLPGEISEQNISSVGLGLRVAWGRNLSGRLDWGYVLQGVKAPVGTTVNGALTGDNKMHATLIWVF